MTALRFQLPFGGRAKITEEVVAIVERHRQHGATDLEAGGFLLGRMIRDTLDVVADEVTEPGPHDERTRFGFHLEDLAHHQAGVNDAWERSAGTCCFLGDWHTHAEPDPTPSSVDLHGWRKRLACDASDQYPRLLFVIVGTVRTRVWQGDRITGEIREATPITDGEALDADVRRAFSEHRHITISAGGFAMKTPFTLGVARDIADALCHARNVALIYPGDPRREAVILALGAVHALGLGGWDVAHARQSVSVTLPPVGSVAAGLLSAIPYVGPLLHRAIGDATQTTVYLSPDAAADPVTLLAVIAHELGHCDQIAAGGLAWCAAYGLVPEVRAGAEAPCYAQDCAVIHALRGDSPQALMDGALERLLSYGLGGDDTMELARGVLNVMRRTLEHGGELGGPSHDVLEALRERGVL